MKIKITFHGMDHSNPMENHAKEKLSKIDELLKTSNWETPKHLELWLNSNPQHPHHSAELHLKTPQFDLNTHYEDTEMYLVIDTVIDKMIKLLIKEKQKVTDKKQKVDTSKKDFANDKYDL